jgi:putative membrane protein insertion efficiency factor
MSCMAPDDVSPGTIGGPLRGAAHVAIRAYQLTLSSLAGGQCRHLPTCSDFTDAAIQRHGLWAGGWMGLARICRCRPGGTAGFDPVPERPPPGAAWHRPWRYGRWRGPLTCDMAEPQGGIEGPPTGTIGPQ